MPYAGRRCVAITRDPVGVGEACGEDPTMPWVDDCEASSMCTGVDPKTSTGTCTRICQQDDECGDDERCVVSNAQDFNACLRVCNPLDDACPIGSACVVLDAGIGCVDDDELPFLAEVRAKVASRAKARASASKRARCPAARATPAAHRCVTWSRRPARPRRRVPCGMRTLRPDSRTSACAALDASLLAWPVCAR